MRLTAGEQLGLAGVEAAAVAKAGYGLRGAGDAMEELAEVGDERQPVAGGNVASLKFLYQGL